MKIQEIIADKFFIYFGLYFYLLTKLNINIICKKKNFDNKMMKYYSFEKLSLVWQNEYKTSSNNL